MGYHTKVKNDPKAKDVRIFDWLIVAINARSKQVNLAGNFFDQDISAATYLRYTANQNIAAFQLNGSGDGRMLDGLPALR